LVATGIGAIVVGIGMLIANFDLLKKGVKDTVEWFKGLGVYVVQAIEYYNELGFAAKALLYVIAAPVILALEAYQYFFGEVEKGTAEMMKAEREAAEERRRQTKALADAHKARIEAIDEEKDAVISAANDTIKALKLEKDTLEANGLASDEATLKILEAEKTKLEAIVEANQKKIESYIKYYTDLAALRGEDEATFKQSMLNQGIDLDALQQKANALIQENLDNVQYAENKITKFKRDQNNKRVKDNDNTQQKIIDAQAKANADYIALQDELDKLTIANMEAGAEKELAILVSKHDKERQMMIQKHGENAELEKALDEKHEQELLKLQEKFDNQRLAKQEELIDLQLANMQEGC
jgi:hypothetical protein